MHEDEWDGGNGLGRLFASLPITIPTHSIPFPFMFSDIHLLPSIG